MWVCVWACLQSTSAHLCKHVCPRDPVSAAGPISGQKYPKISLPSLCVFSLKIKLLLCLLCNLTLWCFNSCHSGTIQKKPWTVLSSGEWDWGLRTHFLLHTLCFIYIVLSYMCVIFIIKWGGDPYHRWAMVCFPVSLKILLLSACHRAEQITKCCQMQLLI